MAVPNTNTFSLQDVVNEVGAVLTSLVACFTNAIACFFDPRYKGDTDRLSNFRNYKSKEIGTIAYSEEVAGSFALHEKHWLKSDPDINYIHTFYSMSYDINHMHMRKAESDGGTPFSTEMTFFLGPGVVTDWCVVDQTHVYIVDKYISGGNYYFRLRWLKHTIRTTITESGYEVIATVTNSVNSAVYSAKNPRVTATSDYVYVANWLSNTNVFYIHKWPINTSSFGSSSTASSLLDSQVETMYIENNILYYSKEFSSFGYIYSNSISSSDGSLSLIDNVFTGQVVTEIVGNGDTYLYYISETFEVLGYITHDGTGNTLSVADTISVTSIRGIDYSKNTGIGVVMYSNRLLGAFCHDSVGDLIIFSSVELTEAGDDYVGLRRGVCAMLNYDYIVGVGNYDVVYNPNDKTYIFSYPVG